MPSLNCCIRGQELRGDVVLQEEARTSCHYCFHPALGGRLVPGMRPGRRDPDGQACVRWRQDATETSAYVRHVWCPITPLCG